jgi:predicted secreted protein
MGVIVKPLNLNDRQVKRVDRIEESNGTYEGRARRVANRIDARRDARGAENPRLAKAMAAKTAMAQPMRKGGKMIKKAQNGITKMVKKAASDTTTKKGMNFDKKSFDSLPKLPMKKAKSGTSFGMLSVKAGVDNNPNPTAADRIAGAKKKAKFGIKIKKAQNGDTTQIKKPSDKGMLIRRGSSAGRMPTLKSKQTLEGSKRGVSMMSKGGKMKMGGKCKNGC